MIPSSYIQAWSTQAPWPDARQIEQDLIISRALCDRVVKRPSRGWRRHISLRIPVHDPNHWGSTKVLGALHEAIGFLTGDRWQISFKKRTSEGPRPQQPHLDFSFKSSAILA